MSGRGTNGRGNFPSTANEAFAAYDALPRTMRDLLKYAHGCWAASQVQLAVDAGLEGSRIASIIARNDRERTLRDYARITRRPPYEPART